MDVAGKAVELGDHERRLVARAWASAVRSCGRRSEGVGALAGSTSSNSAITVPSRLSDESRDALGAWRFKAEA